ncbi:MAG: hypothetical protein ACI9ST_000661 [Psychrobacter glaciei]|jgi:hypothetical protein
MEQIMNTRLLIITIAASLFPSSLILISSNANAAVYCNTRGSCVNVSKCTVGARPGTCYPDATMGVANIVDTPLVKSDTIAFEAIPMNKMDSSLEKHDKKEQNSKADVNLMQR